MKNNSFITIEKFCELLQIDIESAYNILFEEENKEYYKYINSEMLINEEILLKYGVSTDKKESEESAQTPPKATEEISFLLERIATLEKDIEEKEKVIEEKQARIDDLTNKVFSLAERAHEIAERALNTAGQAQTLHAVDKGVIKQEEEQEEEKQKRGLLARLFGKK